jgi:phage protein D
VLISVTATIVDISNAAVTHSTSRYTVVSASMTHVFYKLHSLNACLAQAVLEVVDCVLDSDAAYLHRLADLYTELAHAKDYSTLGYA